MSKKYKEAIDQITASDEIKAKIIAEMMQTAKISLKSPTAPNAVMYSNISVMRHAFVYV